MKHEAIGLFLRRVGRCIPSAPAVHKQCTPFKPAPVRSKDKIHISPDIALFKILPAISQRTVPHGRNTFHAALIGQHILRHLWHQRPAEQRILMRNQPAAKKSASVPGCIQCNSLPHLSPVPCVVADRQVLQRHVISCHHHRIGKKSSFFLSVFIRILCAAQRRDDGALRILPEDMDPVRMNNHPFLICARLHQNPSV